MVPFTTARARLPRHYPDDLRRGDYSGEVLESGLDPPPRRLLVVDDEIQNLSTFKRVFRNRYEIVLASSGAEALRLLAEQPFDVVLTDFGMPEMNGAELVRAAKQIATVAFVMVTGYMDREEVVELQRSGEVHSVVGKPWDRASILAAIEGATTHTLAMRSIGR